MNELTASQIHSFSNIETINYDTPPSDVLVDNMQSHLRWNDEYDGDDDDDGHDDNDDDDDDHTSYISKHGQESQNIEELAPLEVHPEMIDINDNDDVANQGGAAYLLEPINEGVNSEQTSLELFKYDVVSLLNLLINEKFGHPYGTIAGAVA
jgi:hypothetical protein